MGGLLRSRMGGVSAVSVVACCAIVVVAVAMLLTMLPYHGPGAPNANCQSNMSQIGRALKMYLGEWNDQYPLNRPVLKNGKLGRTTAHVKLTPADEPPVNGVPQRFRHGVNWVEALYPYVEAVSKDSHSAWACEVAGKQKYPANSKTAATNYVFNRNMIGRPEIAIRCASNLMVVREMDRLVDSELRPRNYSCGLPDVPPDCPFLGNHDPQVGATNPKPHNQGSNILFADSHVKNFPTEFFPERITAKECWDAEKKQWFNCADLKDGKRYESIAITP